MEQRLWNPDVEAMPRKMLADLQLERLRAAVRRAYDVPFYRRSMDEAGTKPQDIQTLADVSLLPTTGKADLRGGYPLGFLACPLDQVVRFHSSSGTTGKPVISAYTRSDMEVWAEVMARALVGAGVGRGAIVHNAYGYGLFTGGLGFSVGLQKVGAAELPISGGLTRRQVSFLLDLGPSFLTCTPSYALVIAETARTMGIDLKNQGRLRVGIFGAEPWSEGLRRQIEEALGLEAYDIYGLTELIGPGVAVECPLHRGLHVQEDYFLAEILDPQTGRPLPPGETGELCLTTLGKEAMPMLRFRTRDLTRLTTEPCGCGRTTARIDRILGRCDDMLIIRGVNVFPSQIEAVLLARGEVSPHYQVVVDRQASMDTLEIRVELTPGAWTGDLSRLEAVLREELRDALAISAKVQLVEPGGIPRSEGKAKRIIDKRDAGNL